MTTREIYTPFGMHAVAVWQGAVGQGVQVFLNPVYVGASLVGGTQIATSIMSQDNFTFDQDFTGRWWITFTDYTLAIQRWYSENCGNGWVQG